MREKDVKGEFRVSMEVLIQAILNEVITSRSASPRLISIDGYYGAGKTTFSKALLLQAEAYGKNFLVISTDEFMRYSRTERSEILERYLDHPNWYNLEKLSAILNELCGRQQLVIHLENLYNHVSGELDVARDLSFADLDLVVLEGMYALHDRISNIIDLGILLVADHASLLRRVIFRDATERKLDENAVRGRYWIINGAPYQDYLQKALERADLVVDTSSDEEVTLNPLSMSGRLIVDRCRLESLEPYLESWFFKD